MLSSFYHLQPSNRDFIPSMIHQILRPKAEPVTLFRYQARVEADFFTKSIHSIHENSIKNSKTIKIHESQVNFPGNGSSFWHVAKRGRKLPVPLRSVGSLVSWCDDETVKIQWEILMVFWTNPWFFRLIQKLIQKIQKLIQKVMKCPESL